MKNLFNENRLIFVGGEIPGEGAPKAPAIVKAPETGEGLGDHEGLVASFRSYLESDNVSLEKKKVIYEKLSGMYSKPKAFDVSDEASKKKFEDGLKTAAYTVLMSDPKVFGGIFASIENTERASVMGKVYAQEVVRQCEEKAILLDNLNKAKVLKDGGKTPVRTFEVAYTNNVLDVTVDVVDFDSLGEKVVEEAPPVSEQAAIAEINKKGNFLISILSFIGIIDAKDLKGKNKMEMAKKRNDLVAQMATGNGKYGYLKMLFGFIGYDYAKAEVDAAIANLNPGLQQTIAGPRAKLSGFFNKSKVEAKTGDWSIASLDLLVKAEKSARALTKKPTLNADYPLEAGKSLWIEVPAGKSVHLKSGASKALSVIDLARGAEPFEVTDEVLKAEGKSMRLEVLAGQTLGAGCLFEDGLKMWWEEAVVEDDEGAPVEARALAEGADGGDETDGEASGDEATSEDNG